MDELNAIIFGHTAAGISHFEVVGRLALSAVLAAVIGAERERKGQPAGLRTHTVLAIGACLIMLVSMEIYAQNTSGTGDPGRIAAQVVSGIGFLGAGAILRYGATVRGLTTATCLWSVSGIGLATGMGFYIAAVAATILVLLSMVLLEGIEHWLFAGRGGRRLTITCRDRTGIVHQIEEQLSTRDIKMRNYGIERDFVEGRLSINARVDLPQGCDFGDIPQLLADVDGILECEVA